MKRMFKTVAWAAALVCSAQALTLQEAVLYTIETNPIVLERVKNYNATKEDLRIAKSGWLPKLDYLGSAGAEWGERELTGYGWGNYSVFENTLLLTQNIFDGWSTTHQISTQKARLLAAAYKYIEVVHDTSYRLVNYYLEVIKNRELLKIAEENIKINEEIFNKVNKLYENGLTTKSEMEKAAASLSLARSNYVVQKNNLRDAVFQFKYYYGKEVDPAQLKDPKTALPIPRDYESGKAFALRYNPSILVQRYNLEVAKEDYAEKKSRYYPKVDLNARGGWNYNASGQGFGHEDMYRVGATVSYNLFNGFADEAAVQKGISKIRQEALLRQDLERKTEESYDLSWAAYEHLRTKLVHLLKYKEHAADTLRLYSKEYEMGRRSLLDLLSAQNDLINAKSQIVSTLYNYIFAKYRILDAMGTMVPAIVGRIDNYFARVELATDGRNAADTLPTEILEKNDRFLAEVQKSVNEKTLYLFSGETRAQQPRDKEVLAKSLAVSQAVAAREKEQPAVIPAAMEETVSEKEDPNAWLIADTVKKSEEETEPTVEMADETSDRAWRRDEEVKVLQFVTTLKRYRRDAERKAARLERMGLRCWIKDSQDGVHIYLRCLPKKGDFAEIRQLLGRNGVDFMYTKEDAAVLEEHGIDDSYGI